LILTVVAVDGQCACDDGNQCMLDSVPQAERQAEKEEGTPVRAKAYARAVTSLQSPKVVWILFLVERKGCL
jgi:hypothetical protein